MLDVIIDPLGRDHLPALALMPRLSTTLLTTLLLRPLTLASATLLPGQRRIVRRRQRTIRRITLQQAIVLINPLPQRGDLRQQAEHQLNRRLTTRPRDTLRIRNTHERKIPCALKESSRSPRPHVNAYAGLVVGPLIAVILLAAGISHDLVWRLLLGLGAIPGLAVYYLRRQIHETPRFAMAGGASDEAQAAIAQATGKAAPSPGPVRESVARHRQTAMEGFRTLFMNRRLVMWLVGGAGAWFMLDFSYYGNTIASPEIIKLISPGASLIHSTLITLLIFVVAAVPGYALAILLIDRMGRRSIQSLGFTVMAASFAVIGLVPGATASVAPFVILFGISYFFTEFGPNTTTFVYPAEMFPVEVRTSAHGICAAAGKIGGFIGVYLFPQLLSAGGIRRAEDVAAVVAILGLALTVTLLPETKGKSLEELTDEGMGRAPALAPSPA
jgi:MFS family permease